MKKIYIVLTHTGTVLSKIVKYYTKYEYSHISIALDKDLNKMYSFGRLNPYNPFWAGFVHEYIDKGTFKRFKNTTTIIYSLEIADEQYSSIVKLIEKMIEHRKKYKFNILGLFAVSINKKVTAPNSFYCAEFVKYVVENAGIEMTLPEIIKPQDFRNLRNLQIVYTGLLRDYNRGGRQGLNQ